MSSGSFGGCAIAEGLGLPQALNTRGPQRSRLADLASPVVSVHPIDIVSLEANPCRICLSSSCWASGAWSFALFSLQFPLPQPE